MSNAAGGTLGFGLIGCGDIAAKRVARALRETKGSALVAVSRARADLLPAFAAEHGASRWYADWRELLRDQGVHAVYLATPVALHAEQAIAAAEAGKHVLCEKPMALLPDDCARMIAAARAHGVRLGVAYYRHHYPVIARLRTLIRSGELGPPVLGQAQAFETFNPGPDHPRAWLLRKGVSGGGPMADFGCHRVEVLLDLLGPLARARGVATNVRFTDREVEDTFVAHLAFESGAQGLITVSHAALERRDSLEIVAARGSAFVPVLNEGRLRITTEAGVREEHHPPHENLHQPLVEDFVAAVREGRDPAVPGEQGLAVQRVLASVYEAAP